MAIPVGSPPSPATLQAPAKLTLSLRVLGVRPDGYHLIDAEMVSLDLADTVIITPAARSCLAITGPNARGVPTGDDNLVMRALAVVGRTADVRLHKRIAAGAGLGGGSSDAAAVLRWAGVNDLNLAASLGADVAFCLRGGRARVTGIGEHLDPLVPRNQAFTLLTPGLAVPTAAVYQAWDQMGGPVGANGNDLEAAALAVVPELVASRDELHRLSGLAPRLAGSGSTWFVEGEFGGPGLVVARTVRRDGRPRRAEGDAANDPPGVANGWP
ncbi:MAG: 4-(cytidine 5'-diphospho)-2-C-methyl-D-erythritol kinase [Acidimicrobiales bacterium]